MPLVRNNNYLCHFAHVPKCGGTSIESYLVKNGMKLAFYDPYYFKRPAQPKWSISSPQHIDGYSLSRIVPSSFLDFGFGVVRNPVDRFLSAFDHYKRSGAIPADKNVDDFVMLELQEISSHIGVLDNHFLPQVGFFLGELNYKIFRIENGFREIKNFIDRAFKLQNTDTDIRALNRKPETISRSVLKSSSIKEIESVYKCDYETYNY